MFRPRLPRAPAEWLSCFWDDNLKSPSTTQGPGEQSGEDTCSWSKGESSQVKRQVSRNAAKEGGSSGPRASPWHLEESWAPWECRTQQQEDLESWANIWRGEERAWTFRRREKEGFLDKLRQWPGIESDWKTAFSWILYIPFNYCTSKAIG